MSTLSSSPALTSRVTPRSPKKWRSPAKRSSNDKASANFVNSLSSPQHRSPQKQGVVKPEANPRALIDRLSPSTFTGTQGARRRPKPLPSVRSPTGLLDKLMKSEVLSAMLSSEVNTPMDTSGSEQNDAMLTSTSTDDNRNIAKERSTSAQATTTQDLAQEDLQAISPMTSTSAADVEEILGVAGDDQVDSAPPTSPVDGPTVAPVAPSLFERCRRLILPLAIQNTRARDPAVDGVVETKRLEQEVMSLMTDEYCAGSMSTAKKLQEQMAALKKGTVVTSESIVGVKRPREEDDDAAEESTSNRVQCNTDESGLATANRLLPKAPKAMVKIKQNKVLDKFMPMIPNSDPNVLVFPSKTKDDTPPRSAQPEIPTPTPIPIPMEPKDFRRSPTPDSPGSDYDMDKDRSGHRRDHENSNRDIEYRRESAYEKNNPDYRRRDRDDDLRDVDHGHREYRYSDRDGTRKTDHSHIDAQYADSDLDKLHRRGRDHSDKEWDFIRDHKDSSSGSRRHSSSGSSLRHSPALLAGRTSDLGAPIPNTRDQSTVGPRCRVPGLWFVKVGLNHLDVVNLNFEVDPEVASRCCRESSPKVSVRLVCLPTASVEETYKKLDSSASPETVTDAMRNIKPEWPPKGKIIVEVNPGDKAGWSWLPQDLDPEAPLLDLTAHIRPGQNSIRLIHLGDLSDHTFLLHAAETHAASLPVETSTSMSVSTKDVVESDWDDYMTRLQAKPIKQSDVRNGAFRFTATVAVEAQPA